MTNDELDQKWREAQARMKAMKDEEKSGVIKPSRKQSDKKCIKSTAVTARTVAAPSTTRICR